jgi:hypothetical protein
MPVINIEVSDEDHRALSEEHRKASIAWLRINPSAVPPSFEQWLSGQSVECVKQAAMEPDQVDEMRAINAMEKLVTSLQRHGFGLACLGRQGIEPAEAISELAQAVAGELGLPLHTAKRLQELLEYYTKSAKEIADLAHVVITNRAYGALHETFRELVERTAKAADHLGDDRAFGRVEGAVAILAGMRVMTREAAQEKTEAFKQTLREAKE